LRSGSATFVAEPDGFGALAARLANPFSLLLPVNQDLQFPAVRFPVKKPVQPVEKRRSPVLYSVATSLGAALRYWIKIKKRGCSIALKT
jgi:hypothetical protein